MFKPETLKECKYHYITPDYEHITCKNFGQIDGMDGSCHWCFEMIPYQWYMCMDETHKRSLCKKMTEEEAINFIEEYKQRRAHK